MLLNQAAWSPGDAKRRRRRRSRLLTMRVGQRAVHSALVLSSLRSKRLEGRPRAHFGNGLLTNFESFNP